MILKVKYVDSYPHPVAAKPATETSPAVDGYVQIRANYVVIDGDIDTYIADNAAQDKSTKAYQSATDPNHPDNGKPRWTSDGYVGEELFLERRADKTAGIPNGKFRWFTDNLIELEAKQDLRKASPEARAQNGAMELEAIQAKKQALQAKSLASKEAMLAKFNATKKVVEPDLSK